MLTSSALPKKLNKVSGINQDNNCGWLTENLRIKVRNQFEPKYKRKLTNLEVEEIAMNLVGLVQNTLETHARLLKEKSITLRNISNE